METTRKQWMDRMELAAELGCSAQEVSRLHHEEGLPGRLVGRRLIFSRTAVDTWLCTGGSRLKRQSKRHHPRRSRR